MPFLLEVLQILIDVAWWIVVGQFILSILIAFNVINLYNDVVRSIWNALLTVTEPVYRPIRRVLPDFGPIDFSPMVVLIILALLRHAVIRAANGGLF